MTTDLKAGATACFSIALLAIQAHAAPIVTAEFSPPPGLNGGFNVGAGMGIDPPAPTPFDNRLAQTFVATIAGRPATASIIAGRSSSTDAAMWVDIVTFNGGQVSSVLASGSVHAAVFADWIDVDATGFNVTVDLTATAELAAGQEYAMVLRSATTDANYRVFGTDDVDYTAGAAWRSQNSPTFQAMLFGADLFFQVSVAAVPEPASSGLFTSALAISMLVRRQEWRRRGVTGR